jgi:hypothetical protein
MPDHDGLTTSRPDHFALDRTQPHLNPPTVEPKSSSPQLENRSIPGSERLRRIRFDQAPFDSSNNGSTAGFSHEHTTANSGSIAGEQRMSENQGRGNNQGDVASVLSYNSTRDVNQFVKEVHGR